MGICCSKVVVTRFPFYVPTPRYLTVLCSPFLQCQQEQKWVEGPGPGNAALLVMLWSRLCTSTVTLWQSGTQTTARWLTDGRICTWIQWLEMTHVPVRMEQNSSSFHHTAHMLRTLKLINCLFLEISLLIFSDWDGLQITETTESRAAGEWGLLWSPLRSIFRGQWGRESVRTKIMADTMKMLQWNPLLPMLS